MDVKAKIRSGKRRLALLGAIGVLTQCPAVQASPDSIAVGAKVETSTSHKACASVAQLKVAGRMLLQPDCIYATTVVIRNGDAELDCRGSVIDPGSLKGYAVLIDSGGQPMSNVTIRNCVIRNSNAIGIVIAWRDPDRVKADRFTKEEIYSRSPRDVRIINTRVENAAGAGIYVDDYVSDVTLSNVSLIRSEAMGVYLEHSSRNITIENSFFEDNSRGKNREALAIDSSAGNVIRGNVFRGNKAGAVFLYKNCFEKSHSDRNQVVRWQGANDNTIENNLFEDEVIGVWIASRQSRDLRKMDCGDPYYEGRYVLDQAQGNSVRNNTFRRVTQGVLVEDDRNEVIDNAFELVDEVCVRVGSGPRARYLRRPVSAVSVRSNRCGLREKAPSGLTGIEFVHGAKP